MIGVDASVVAKWAFTEEYSTQARALVREALANAEPLVAPPLLRIELTNIIRQRMRRERIALADAQQQLSALLRIPVTLLMPESLHRRALEIAEQYDLPAVYDAHYIALSEQLSCVFWTDDRRLLRALGGRLPFVRWIADYSG